MEEKVEVERALCDVTEDVLETAQPRILLEDSV